MGPFYAGRQDNDADTMLILTISFRELRSTMTCTLNLNGDDVLLEVHDYDVRVVSRSPQHRAVQFALNTFPFLPTAVMRC